MNANLFIQTSSWLVQHGDRPVCPERWTCLLTDRFWPDTKIRNQRWQARLCELEPNLRAKSSSAMVRSWFRFARLVREVVVSETLSRIWFAVAVSQARESDVQDIADYVIAEHVQTRDRILVQLASGPPDVRKLIDRLRKLSILSQQLTDLMLSQLPAADVARAFSVSPALFDEFKDCAGGYEAGVLKQANRVLCRSLGSDISRLAGRIANVDLNQRMVDAMVQFLSGDDTDTQTAHSDPAAICLPG